MNAICVGFLERLICGALIVTEPWTLIGILIGALICFSVPREKR